MDVSSSTTIVEIGHQEMLVLNVEDDIEHSHISPSWYLVKEAYIHKTNQKFNAYDD